jgi:hypothetical protein
VLTILLIVAFATGLLLRPWMDWVLESDTFALIEATVLQTFRRKPKENKRAAAMAVAHPA